MNYEKYSQIKSDSFIPYPPHSTIYNNAFHHNLSDNIYMNKDHLTAGPCYNRLEPSQYHYLTNYFLENENYMKNEFLFNEFPNFNPKIAVKALNEDQYILINSKQVDRILKRREQRKKQNLASRTYNKEERPKYIHESRHKHACNRERNKSGRFLSKKGDDKTDVDITIKKD